MNEPDVQYEILDHHEHHDLVCSIFHQIAKEKHKPVERIKRLLFIKQNKAIVKRFWALVDEYVPDHAYQYVGCCPGCGSFELCDVPPVDAIIE